jgi:pantoate--beta-alanine ligase
MKVIERISELKPLLSELKYQSTGRTRIGFVPTMGYLHEGHMSLVKRAKAACDVVVLSIFVNPLQFGPNEDYDRYPRDTERDLSMARENGADIVFLPSVKEMYPEPTLTKVVVSQVTSALCGRSRPGHFEGVATVVAKLFNIAQPDLAFFGLKDAQQVAVIQQMVNDLNMNVRIIPCPTLREADGLAMSSRNVYLDDTQRKDAAVLSHALMKAEDWLRMDNMTVDGLKRNIERLIGEKPSAEIDYVEILTYPSLAPFAPDLKVKDIPAKQQWTIALAVKFGNIRLIDNRIFNAKEVETGV